MLSAVIHLHGHRAPASTLAKVEDWDRVFSCFLHEIMGEIADMNGDTLW